MYKYELYEVDTMVGGDTLVAVSNDLEKLRKYAFNKYSSNTDSPFNKEIEILEGNILYRYKNQGGAYMGSGYEPHGLIKLAQTNITIIE